MRELLDELVRVDKAVFAAAVCFFGWRVAFAVKDLHKRIERLERGE